MGSYLVQCNFKMSKIKKFDITKKSTKMKMNIES